MDKQRCPIEEIAEFLNSKIQGWINYQVKFRKHKLNSLFRILKGGLQSGREGGISAQVDLISKRASGSTDSRRITLNYLLIGKEDVLTHNFMYNKICMMGDYHVMF